MGASDKEPRGVEVVVELGEAGEPKPVGEGLEVKVGGTGVGDSVLSMEEAAVTVGAKGVPVLTAEERGVQEFGLEAEFKVPVI